MNNVALNELKSRMDEIVFSLVENPAKYSAAITACVWLEDEARMPVYEKLYTRFAESMNTIDSQRNDGPREMTEV